MLQSKLDELFKKVDEIQRDRRDEMESVSNEHQARIRSLKDALEELKAKHAVEVEDLQAAHRDELRKAQAESKDELDHAREQHAAAMTETQQEHETQVQQLKQEADSLRQTSDDFKSHIERVRPGQEALKKEFERQRAQLEQVTTEHQKELEKQRGELEEVTAEHQRELDAQRAQHDMAVAQLNQRMTAELDRYRDRLRQEREDHRRALAVQRVDNADSAFQPAEADLQRKYAELKLAVQVVTEPFNLGRVRSLRGARLDPTRFLEREAEEQGAMRFLLQSAVWARVMDGFFSAPCGFGALGSGDGRRMLTDLYRAWLRLFTPRDGESGGKFSPHLFGRQTRIWALGLLPLFQMRSPRTLISNAFCKTGTQISGALRRFTHF